MSFNDCKCGLAIRQKQSPSRCLDVSNYVILFIQPIYMNNDPAVKYLTKIFFKLLYYSESLRHFNDQF